MPVSPVGERFPEQAPPAAFPQEFYEDKRNGHGVSMFLPDQPVDFPNGTYGSLDRTTFMEVTKIVKTADETGSVLVTGEPGSGKSHLVEDITMACAAHSVPFMTLSLHINGGGARGAANAREAIEQFRDGKDGKRGMVIVDNVDYLGYRGKSRSRSRTANYAQDIKAIVDDLIADGGIVVIGTAHDDEWREGRWAWRDDAIDGPSQAVLEAFASRTVFEGKLSLLGLVDIVRSRGHSKMESVRLVRRLHQAGRATYFNAKHLDPHTYEVDPEAAVAKIQQGRAERKNPSAAPRMIDLTQIG